MNWNGRIYVDEEQITPEQYKMFFGKYEFGISFDMANSILKNRTEGELGEVVPADELCEEAKQQIKDIVMYGDTSGDIEIGGQTLHFDWDIEISDEDEEGEPLDREWADLEDWEKKKILTDMLDNECVWGMW